MLDADLQHPPALIARLIEAWRNGAKVVHAVRTETKKIGPVKRLTSRLYYWIFQALSETSLQANAADFRLMDRQAVEVLKSMKERQRFLRGMVGWLGFPEASVPFTAEARAGGETKYTWRKMLRMAGDGIFSFSTKPLRLAFWLGLCVLAGNAAYAVYLLYMHFVYKTTVPGWTSMILVVMFLGSSQLIILGILGEYIGRIYAETKERPLFVLKELRGSQALLKTT
jgi:dolichol-phosphate mannosyltransferase